MRPIFRFIGSKYYQRNFIYEVFNRIKHDLYVEVFGGSGVLLINKPKVKNECYNDTNKDLVNFFRVVRDKKNADDLRYLCENSVNSREIFDEMRDIVNGRQKDLKANFLGGYSKEVVKAYALMYIHGYGFGGLLIRTWERIKLERQ